MRKKTQKRMTMGDDESGGQKEVDMRHVHPTTTSAITIVFVKVAELVV